MNNSMKFTGTYFGKVGNDISSCNKDLLCALKLADLSFEAVAEPVLDVRGNPIPRTQNVARQDNGLSLGVVGAGYKITQPRNAFKYLSALPGGANFQRGGMLKGGRFFLSAEFDTFDAADGDKMTAYGVFLSSFDGSWANRIVWVLGRHSCTNISRYEIGSAKVGVSNGKGGRAAKHTKNHDIKLDSFIIELQLAQTNLQSEVSKLSKKKISSEQFSTLVEKVIESDSTRAENMRDEIISYFTREDLGIKGSSLWDAYNAFSAYDTHSATRRATSVASSEENAFDALIAGRGFCDRALPVLMEFSAG